MLLVRVDCKYVFFHAEEFYLFRLCHNYYIMHDIQSCISDIVITMVIRFIQATVKCSEEHYILVRPC